MKRSSTFLKMVLLLIAVIVFAGLLWFPQTEGRAANLNLLQIYLDPFILYIYLASIPFFVALFHAFTLLGYVEKNKIFSPAAVTSVRNIKYCALTIVGGIIAALIYIRMFAGGDDPAGPTMLGMITILASAVIATASAIFQKLLQNAVDMKSENDLTV